MGLSLSPERGSEGCIREVLQEDRCSSMYSNYYAFVILLCHVFTYHVTISCIQGICFVILIGVYFSQVKNRPWLPWVYSWIWHRCEQLPVSFIQRFQWSVNDFFIYQNSYFLVTLLSAASVSSEGIFRFCHNMEWLHLQCILYVDSHTKIPLWWKKYCMFMLWTCRIKYTV